MDIVNILINFEYNLENKLIFINLKNLFFLLKILFLLLFIFINNNTLKKKKIFKNIELNYI